MFSWRSREPIGAEPECPETKQWQTLMLKKMASDGFPRKAMQIEGARCIDAITIIWM